MRVLAVILLLLGLIFLIAASEGSTVTRMITGAVSCGVGVLLLHHSGRKNAPDRGGDGVVQHIDFSGDVNLQEINCKKCGGSLSSKDVAVKAGAVFITCPYCHSEYQIEEAPKW